MTAAKEIMELERDYRSFEWPRPVFELALRWLSLPLGASFAVAATSTILLGDHREGALLGVDASQGVG